VKGSAHALAAAEKASTEAALVAQPLLAVRLFDALQKSHSQECLCYLKIRRHDDAIHDDCQSK
jgi:hypothetical protein